jgi:hypothetical protein
MSRRGRSRPWDNPTARRRSWSGDPEAGGQAQSAHDPRGQFAEVTARRTYLTYEKARAILAIHRPQPWCWWLLGRLAYCVACGGHWRCQPARDARAYLDQLDPPYLPVGRT